MATAWLGFGHAFALCDESDQAVAAYRTALRLFPGLHLPLVCIGMEYQRTNNLPLVTSRPDHGNLGCVFYVAHPTSSRLVLGAKREPILRAQCSATWYEINIASALRRLKSCLRRRSSCALEARSSTTN